jgi:3-mercaptopyruvate sulfurtransferase SseA
MRLKFVYLTFAFLAAVMLSSCNAVDSKGRSQKAANSAASPEITYADGARRITIDELETMIKNGEAFIVDVRNQASYDAGHIPGSRLIPSAEILNHLNELPKDKTIVTYCS